MLSARFRVLEPQLSLVALSLTCLVVASSADDSVQCRELGFTGLQLCSDCDALATYVSDAELVEDCRKCCTADLRPTARKYTSALLEAYLERIGAYPHVEEFIKKKADQHPGLKVVNRFGTAPRLTLRAGTEREVVRIDGWKTEHIEEYLADKLVGKPVPPTRHPGVPGLGRTREKLEE